MIEKVNPCHPDKMADRIAGAIVDLAYKKNENNEIAVEVLLGHGICTVIIESSEHFTMDEIEPIVFRITKDCRLEIHLKSVEQDIHLANNQNKKVRCGDNGIFLGLPITDEEVECSKLAHLMYDRFGCDGKYIVDKDQSKMIVCQSNATEEDIRKIVESEFPTYKNIIINPLGQWEGGINVDTGATNRKLGSDMGHSVTGGGLHGKSYSKADVSINIYAFMKAQKTNEPVMLNCAIGDEFVDGVEYSEIVKMAKNYINYLGGFEKFAEYGLI